MPSPDGKISMKALDLAHVTLINNKELKSVPERSQEGLKQLMWSLHCGNTLSNRFSPQELRRGKKAKSKKSQKKGTAQENCPGDYNSNRELYFLQTEQKSRQKKEPAIPCELPFRLWP